jgi:uncharacterized protein (DUF1697 family)
MRKTSKAAAAPSGSPIRARDDRGTMHYVLLLRGVNVGTKNSLPMVELREMLTKLGCSGARTYVQSGNAVFGTKLDTDALTNAVEAALERKMGRPIATTLRTHEQLQAVVDANPFAEIATNPAYQCVTFLTEPPSSAALAPLEGRTFDPEAFRVIGREIHSWHPDGQARSPLAAAIGKLKVRGAVTTRNWNTVQKLLAMLAEARGD